MSLPTGIAAVGAFVPRLRLPRARIVEAIGWANAPARSQPSGARSICNWDEDALTLAVEAARSALASGTAHTIDALLVASTTLPFADRDNAALIAAALDLPESLQTLDCGASLRAGTSALARAAPQGKSATLVVATDARRARPASREELAFGHGAAAYLVTAVGADTLATLLGSTHLTSDFVDHYRMADEDFDYSLEERWVRDEAYSKLVPRAVESALAALAIAPDAIRHFVVPAPAAIAARLAARCKFDPGTVAETLHASCGDTGTAHPLLMLAAVLESAAPGEHIVVVGFGQGVDVLVLRTEAALAKRRLRPVAATLARAAEEKSYLRYLAHAGILDVDFGMRAERDSRSAHSVAYRKRRAVSGFVGGRCSACATVQFPRSRVCVNPECRASDTQQDFRLADREGRVKSFTEDWQAFSPRPPYSYGNVEFDAGGNLFMDLADFEPGELAVNARVRFMFRIKDFDRLRGFRRYFWKAVKV